MKQPNLSEGDAPKWTVWRQDDSGGKFLMASNLTEEQARKLASEFEAKGHKQTYWCEATS